MQAVQYKPSYGKNFIKENIRHVRIMKCRLQNETASPEAEIRCFTSATSPSKRDRHARRNLTASASKKKALVGCLQGILNKSHSARGRKYLPRYQRSHQKAEPANSLQYTAPVNLRPKKPSASLRKKRLSRRKCTEEKFGEIDLLHNKLSDVPVVSSLQSNARNAVPNISSYMFAQKALQQKGKRKSKLLQRKLKRLRKLWQTSADNIAKYDPIDSEENSMMLNDNKSSASQCTTLTSSTFDAKARDTLRTTVHDPGLNETLHLSNKNLTHDAENENYTSVANEKSVDSSKRNIDVITMEPKPIETSSQELLNISYSNLKQDLSRGLTSDEQHEFGQQLIELDYHIGNTPCLAFKRRKSFNSFNKEQTHRTNFIKENIRQLRKMQIHLNEKRSRATPATLLQSRDEKAAPKKLSQFPTSQTSQKNCNRENAIARRKVKNKVTNQRKVYLHKVTRTNLDKYEHECTDIDQSSLTTSLTSIHDSGSNIAGDEILRNSNDEPGNNKETDHLTLSYEKENILHPDGYESLKSEKIYSDTKVKTQNFLDPDLVDALNTSSLQPRKTFSESLNVKMTAKAIAAKRKVLAPSPPNPLKAPPSYQKGVLPRYLLSQQEKKQKKERDCQLSDPDCPHGYVRLPDMERRETLSILRKYFGDLIQGMNMLPVQSTALKIQQQKMELEKQLDKLEAAIKVFSKPKVFMKVGS